MMHIITEEDIGREFEAVYYGEEAVATLVDINEDLAYYYKFSFQLPYRDPFPVFLDENLSLGDDVRILLPKEAEAPLETRDMVNNPSHYQLLPGVEAIDIIKATLTPEQWKGYCLGNMLKYRLRAGDKGDALEDIGKANKYKEFYEEK